jgi:hypothetical protein
VEELITILLRNEKASRGVFSIGRIRSSSVAELSQVTLLFKGGKPWTP